MEAIAVLTPPKIPDNLIWEVLDGQPLYRRGYLNEDIVFGKNSYQKVIASYITRVLINELDDDCYDLMLGDLGVQLNETDYISSDIAIFERLSGDKFSKKYVDFAPKIVIEVDIDIDPSSLSDVDYLNKKTQKMLSFGVERVIWILTNSKKVLVATPNNDWLTMDWDKDIEILDGIFFNIQTYLTSRNIDI